MTPSAATILYLVDYTDFGGGETAFLALMEAMRREASARWRPVVVLPSEGPLPAALRAAGVDVRILPYPRRLRVGPFPWISLTARRGLRALLADLRPALIHAHNFFGLVYGGWAARAAGLPVVWTCHGWFELDGTLKRKLITRLADRIACVSEAVREEAARLIPAVQGRLVTDYLGIEPYATQFAEEDRATLRHAFRNALDTPRDAPLIAVVARFQPIKGHALLLAALDRILAELPETHVWLIGGALESDSGEAAHKAAIQAQVTQAGWGGRVHFLGARRDARRLMRAVDLVAIPSARESFSMVAVEALEAGVPTLGPDGWGPREIIAAPATGERFKPGDAADFARQAIRLLRRETEFNPEAGPRRVAEQFTTRAHLQRTEAIYDELLRQDHRRR